MTREEMIEFFKKKAEVYVKIPESVMDYVNGKSNKLEKIVGSNRFYYYQDDFKPIIKELEGENKELAKRILYSASRMKDGTLCTWSIKERKSIKFLIEIGYTFEELLKQITRSNRLSAVDNASYNMFDVCYDYYKNEVEAYARQNFTSYYINQYKHIEKPSDCSLEFYLSMICAVVLLNRDEEKYVKYKEMLSEYFKSVSLCTQFGIVNKHLLFILFKGYKYHEVLFNRLEGGILNNYYISEFVRSLFGYKHEDEYLEFLQENNIKTYPYYSLLALERGYTKADVFKKLIKDDKETVLEAYEFVRKIPKRTEESLSLLALLVKYDERYDLLERDRDAFRKITMINDRSNEFGLIINGTESGDRYLEENYSKAANAMNVFALFYDYDEEVKKFIDIIIEKGKAKKLNYNLYYVVERFLYTRNRWLDSDIKKDFNRMFNDFLELDDAIYFISCDSSNHIFTHEILKEYEVDYEKEVLEFVNNKAIKGDIDKTINYLNYICYHTDYDKYDVIVAVISNKSKTVRDFCEEYILKNKDMFRKRLEENVKKFKGEGLKLVKRIIKAWDNEEKYGSDFKFIDNESVIEFINSNYDNDNEKLTKWIDEVTFENVRFNNSEKIAPAKVIRFIFNEYMALSDVYRIKSCDKIIEMLNIHDFRDAACTVFKLWLDNNSDAKKKNIGIPYCIYSSDETILAMKKQLEVWAKKSRGAIAAYMVKAIALNGNKSTLMMLESIGNKFPNAMVKKAAKSAFSYAAKVLEIPEDVLCDKIVPNLDFDKYGEKIIDYGSRTFKITLMEDFSLSIYDNEKNKTIKSLPKANSNDDAIKAETARKEFTALKKQIKAVVKNQTERLEQVLINGRTWTLPAWKELFIENPIMQMFARKLIWGAVDKNNNIIETFRYMEDGTFNSADEEEIELPENTLITLVHPVELEEELIDKWKEQLEDYEIIQPFTQMNLKPALLTEEDMDNNIIIKYSKYSTKSGDLLKLHTKYNLLRGEILDGGAYISYHYVDKYLNIAAEIKFEYLCVGYAEYDEDVSLGDVTFYKIDENFNDDPEDDINENLILNPRKISKRFVSSVISIFDELI